MITARPPRSVRNIQHHSPVKETRPHSGDQCSKPLVRQARHLLGPTPLRPVRTTGTQSSRLDLAATKPCGQAGDSRKTEIADGSSPAYELTGRSCCRTRRQARRALSTAVGETCRLWCCSSGYAARPRGRGPRDRSARPPLLWPTVPRSGSSTASPTCRCTRRRPGPPSTWSALMGWMSPSSSSASPSAPHEAPHHRHPFGYPSVARDVCGPWDCGGPAIRRRLNMSHLVQESAGVRTDDELAAPRCRMRGRSAAGLHRRRFHFRCGRASPGGPARRRPGLGAEMAALQRRSAARIRMRHDQGASRLRPSSVAQHRTGRDQTPGHRPHTAGRIVVLQPWWTWRCRDRGAAGAV